MSAPRATLSARLSGILALVLLPALGIVAYHNSFAVPFLLDDEEAIRDNPRIRTLWSSGDEGYAVQSTESGRPVVRLSLALNYALGALDLGEDGPWNRAARFLGVGLGALHVRGYHVFNLAVHVLSALVAFGLVRRTLELPGVLAEPLRASAPLLALGVAALWLVHPLQTDAVTYLIQRTELLMGLFCLATLLFSLRAHGARRPWVFGLASVLCCALGMASKESMFAAPLLVPLHDRAFLFPSWRAALARRWRLYAGLASTWLILLALVLSGPRNRTVGFDLGVAWWEYGATQLGMILHYLRLTFWPDALCLDYGRVLARGAAEIVPGALVVGALGAGTLWALVRRPRLGFLGAWFFLILAPSSSIVPIISEIGAERRMHLPLLSVVSLVVLGGAWLLTRAVPRPPAGQAGGGASPVALALLGCAIAALVLVASWRTVQRNHDFRSDLSIWSDTVQKRPGNFVARNNLGRAYSRRRRYDEALQQFEAAISLPSITEEVRVNYGIALMDAGRLEQAEALFQELLRQDPSSSIAHGGLGRLRFRQGRWEDAARAYRRCIDLGLRSADLHFELGTALVRAGRIPEGLGEFQAALALDPHHAPAREQLAEVQATLETRPGSGR